MFSNCNLQSQLWYHPHFGYHPQHSYQVFEAFAHWVCTTWNKTGKLWQNPNARGISQALCCRRGDPHSALPHDIYLERHWDTGDSVQSPHKGSLAGQGRQSGTGSLRYQSTPICEIANIWSHCSCCQLQIECCTVWLETECQYQNHLPVGCPQYFLQHWRSGAKMEPNLGEIKYEWFKQMWLCQPIYDVDNI